MCVCVYTHMYGLYNFYICVHVCVCVHIYIWASLVAQLVKNLPTMQETLVQFLGPDNPLERGSATHSGILGLLWWLRW